MTADSSGRRLFQKDEKWGCQLVAPVRGSPCRWFCSALLADSSPGLVARALFCKKRGALETATFEDE